MTTNDSKAAENLEKSAKELMPLGVLEAEPVALAPKMAPKPKHTPGSRPLAKRKWEQVAELVAYEAHTFAEAYAKVYGGEAKKVRANAARLKREHPEIMERVEFLDREVKEEAMLHRGTTFAKTINKLNDIMEAMDNKKSNPRAAAVMISAAGLILKATGQDGAAQTTVEETVSESETKEILPGLMASLKRVVTRRRTE